MKPIKTVWEELFFVTEHRGAAICLVCCTKFNCIRKSSIKRHYDNYHANDYKNMTGRWRKQKLHSLKENLRQCEGDLLDEVSHFSSYGLFHVRSIISYVKTIVYCGGFLL